MIEHKLELRRVDSAEFSKHLKSLDKEGTFPLSIANGNEHHIFFENNKPVGYVVSSENLSRVTGFAVHQDYRKQGHGGSIIEYLKQSARENGNRLVVGALPSTYGFFQDCGLGITDHDVGEVWLADY